MSFLQMSISGGVLILIVTVVRALTIYRLPKGMFFALWWITAFRLMLPFSIPIPFSIFTNVGHLTSGSGTIGSAVHTQNTIPIHTAVWLTVMLLMAVYFVITYIRFRLKFRSAPVSYPGVEDWLTEHSIKRTIEIRVSDQISSPLTYGVIHPVILLPSCMEYNAETLSYVLNHEYMHIRRFDAVTKLIFSAVLCLHWFNPLVWVMYVLANRDIELSCDELVLRTAGVDKRSNYALTLITMEETRSTHLLCNYFSKNAIEERIQSIMKYRKTSILAIVLAIVLTIGCTVAFAASGSTETPEENDGGNVNYNLDTGDDTILTDDEFNNVEIEAYDEIVEYQYEITENDGGFNIERIDEIIDSEDGNISTYVYSDEDGQLIMQIEEPYPSENTDA